MGKKESLKGKYKDFFDVGVSVEKKYLDLYSEIIKKHFSSITPENAFKFEIIHPDEKDFDFKEADYLVKYAKINNMVVRGHTLMWHEQLPEWVKQKLINETNKQKSWEIIENHISCILDRYKNDVDYWDLVNEVLSDQDGVFRKTIWFDILGGDYIENIFKIARNVLSKGKFFINEYNVHIPEKREKMKFLLEKLHKNGINVDGIGIQGHYNITFPAIKMIEDELDFYHSLGVKVHITELDISVFDFFDHRTDLVCPTEEMIRNQEEMYCRLFELYQKYKNMVDSVTIWGVSDKTTWLNDYPVNNRQDWPLLFDSELKPKSVLNRLIKI